MSKPRRSGEVERLRAQVARLEAEIQRLNGRHGSYTKALRDENADLRRLCAALEERLRAQADPGSGGDIERLMRGRPDPNPRRRD